MNFLKYSHSYIKSMRLAKYGAQLTPIGMPIRVRVRVRVRVRARVRVRVGVRLRVRRS